MRVNLDLQVPYLGSAVIKHVDAHHVWGGTGQAGHSCACMQPSVLGGMQHISIRSAMRHGAGQLVEQSVDDMFLSDMLFQCRLPRP